MTVKHCFICEALKERKENKIKRQGEPLSRRFGNIVLNCHANEEQWTEKCRERWVEKEIVEEKSCLIIRRQQQEVCFKFNLN